MANDELAREPKVDPGVYRHFKGGHYIVLGEAARADDTGIFVVYVDASGKMWVRLRCDFLKPVPDSDVPRFQLIRGIKINHLTVHQLLMQEPDHGG